MATSASGGRFRPEVQALRALAVTGVVVYHVWPHALPGGFVGVDVFFVISGFLITGQLAQEISRTGRVSLASFWSRRIRRILPAAFAVLLVCLVLAALVMPALERQSNAEEIRAAGLYVENWVLAAHAVDYLAAENTPSLVQHYWSLSVEEQFYLVWPLLLLLAVPVTARLRLARPRFALLCLLTVVGTASFVLSVSSTSANAPLAFFGTPSRAWEFALGGLVAVLAPRATRERDRGAWAAVSWCGLGLVVGSFVVISAADAFPGWLALVPVVGTALVIGAGRSFVRWSPATLLERAPVQWLGDHSYSVYLWHWPLLIVAPWVVAAPASAQTRVAIVLATLALAAVTKRFVEDPVRTGRRWRASHAPAFALALVGALAIAALGSGLTSNVKRQETVALAEARAHAHVEIGHLLTTPSHSCFGAAAMVAANRCENPFRRPPDLDLTFAAGDGRTDPCLQKVDAATPELCTLGAKGTPTKTIAVVGNSHAWRLVPALTLYAQHHHWRIVTALRINCLGLISTPLAAQGPTTNCLRWSAAVQQRLLSWPGLDAVVFPSYAFAQKFLVGDAATPTQVQTAASAVLATWDRFVAHGIRVVVPEDVPGMRPTDDPQCIAQSRQRDDPCATSRSSVVRPNLTASLAVENPAKARFVPLSQFFCDARKCHALIGGVVVYFDSHHMTTTFSQSLAGYLGAQVAAAMSGAA